jgi:putative membrane protein
MTFFWTLLKGLGMGAADVVPGVSGGTVAYITGIYQRLLDAISAVGPTAWKAFRQDGIAGAWKAVDGSFLLALGSGIAVSILSLSKAILWGLDHYPPVVWGFFFGLIVGSLPLILRGIPKKQATKAFPLLLLGIGIGFGLSILSPTEATLSLPYIFLSGALAICAMILPGISGSFILVLLGAYEGVLEGLHARDWALIFTFMAGAGVGLLSFARLLRWLFAQFPTAMVLTMAGFIIGSLAKIWPFQAAYASTVSPVWTITAMVCGWALVAGLNRWAKTLPAE